MPAPAPRPAHIPGPREDLDHRTFDEGLTIYAHNLADTTPDPGGPQAARPRPPQRWAVTQPRLRQIRRGVRMALALGIAASLAANVLHADANLVSRLIAAWPPAALAITVELISRVPVASRRLSVARLAGTTVVAGIAAWVSYWHMAAVARRYGEDGASAHLIPLSVDGLVVVASVCLVEINRQIRALEQPAAPVTATPVQVHPVPVAPGPNATAPAVAVPAVAVPAVAVPAQVTPEVPPPEAAAVPPVGQRRQALAELVARLPASDPRSISELAADLGPRVGLRSSTARKYIGAMRNGSGSGGHS